jgi:hypothetical protein
MLPTEDRPVLHRSDSKFAWNMIPPQLPSSCAPATATTALRSLETFPLWSSEAHSQCKGGPGQSPRGSWPGWPLPSSALRYLSSSTGSGPAAVILSVKSSVDRLILFMHGPIALASDGLIYKPAGSSSTSIFFLWSRDHQVELGIDYWMI